MTDFLKRNAFLIAACWLFEINSILAEYFAWFIATYWHGLILYSSKYHIVNRVSGTTLKFNYLFINLRLRLNNLSIYQILLHKNQKMDKLFNDLALTHNKFRKLYLLYQHSRDNWIRKAAKKGIFVVWVWGGNYKQKKNH